MLYLCRQISKMEITRELSETIKGRRKQLKMTLQSLSTECKVAVSTLSMIESGGLKVLKDDTYERIAKALSIEDYSPSENIFKIGFGHTLWAAPYILALSKANNRDVKFIKSASFTESDQSNNEEIIPKYIDFGEILNDEILQTPGVVYNPNQDSTEDFDSITSISTINSESIVQKELKAYSAPNLIALLEENELDGIFIPSSVLDYYTTAKNEFIKVATLVSSSYGGTLLSVYGSDVFFRETEMSSDKSGSHNKFNSLNELLEHCLNLNTEDITIVNVLYPQRTICEEHYKMAFIHFKNEWMENKSKKIKFVEKRIEDLSLTKDIALFVKEMLDRKELVFLLGWHPLSDWIESAVKLEVSSRNNDIKVFYYDLLQQMPDFIHPMTFDFSLVMRKSDIQNKNYKGDLMLNTLLNILLVNIKEINKEIANLKIRFRETPSLRLVYRDSGEYIIPIVAKYLNMREGECAYALTKITFFLSLYPEFYFCDKE
jgi:transcriptional regulator with XRE-family HTH domain